MRSLYLAALLLLAPAARADITIISDTPSPCVVAFKTAQLAVAWVRTVAGDMTPEQYLALYGVIYSGDSDAISNAKTIVADCMGQAS